MYIRRKITKLMNNNNQISKILEAGKIILYPTDTVWGLGCDATNPSAVAKIFQIKQRSETKSLIVLVDSVSMLQHYVTEIPERVLCYIETLKCPTTIIYQYPKYLASNVVATDNTVAIRIVQDTFCQQIITNFGKPIVSTSANISGETTPQYYQMISPEIIAKCDYVVPHRQDETIIRNPSRLIRFDRNGEIEILR